MKFGKPVPLKEKKKSNPLIKYTVKFVLSLFIVFILIDLFKNSKPLNELALTGFLIIVLFAVLNAVKYFMYNFNKRISQQVDDERLIFVNPVLATTIYLCMLVGPILVTIGLWSEYHLIALAAGFILFVILVA